MTSSHINDTLYIDDKELASPRQGKVAVSKETLAIGGARGAFFVFITGPDSGKVVPVRKSRMTIGRDRKSDIVIEKRSASKNHAEVMTTARKTIIRDQGSKNGTYVNEQKVTEAELRDKDEIQIGHVIVQYFHMDLDAEEKGRGKSAKGAQTGSKFYRQAFALCEPLFGSRTRQFLDRQIKAHLKKDPETIAASDKKELARWVKISAGLLLDDERAATLADSILAVP